MPIDTVVPILKIFEELNPDPKTELYYNNSYTLLVAVILSAQSTDKGVNRVTEKLFQIADTPSKMLELDFEELLHHLKHIGLYKAKARYITEMSRVLLEKHKEKVPLTLEELMCLPGVGRKTANVVLNVLLNALTMPVDTHVFRVSHRLGWSEGKTPYDVERDLLTLIPKEYLPKAHHWLILHGRYICKARLPKCKECSVSAWCPSALL